MNKSVYINETGLWFYDNWTGNVNYLLAVPSIWFCVASPLDVCRLQSSSATKLHVPFRFIGFFKTVSVSLVLLVSVIRIMFAITSVATMKFPTDSDINLLALHIFRTFTLLCATMHTMYVRSQGHVTSGVLFLFWLLELMVSVSVMLLMSEESRLRKFTMYAHLSFVILSLLASCFADRISLRRIKQDVSPELQASFLSTLTFSFTIPKNISKLLPPLIEKNPCETTSDSVDAEYLVETPPRCDKITDEDTEPHPPENTESYCSVTFTLLRTFWWEFMFLQLLVAIQIGVVFTGPIILKQLIKFTHAVGVSPSWGYLLVVAMFLSASTSALLAEHIEQKSFRIGMKMRVALAAAIYHKVLTITNEARQTSTIGEIVNLVEVDAGRAQDGTMALWRAWMGAVKIIIGMVMLYRTIGVSMFAGLAVVVALVPLNIVMAIKITSLQDSMMRKKDERIKLITEMLSSIKIVKLHAWEHSIEENIRVVRKGELTDARNIQFLNCCSMTVWVLAPYLISLAMFITYIYISVDHFLSAEMTFVALSIINIIRDSLINLPVNISDLVASLVSLRRVSRFLCHDDLDESNVTQNCLQDEAISIKNGTFEWTPSLGPCLSQINVTIPPNKLTAVVGQVGSGKSSLLSAMLGDMHKLSGSVTCNGSVAYVPQTAWIQNATLKDNILFVNKSYTEQYNKVLDCCALRHDLDLLPAGDLTEIGENGINLSGGQKQRVSLARAVYNDADIYLLDDPLSAVDAHVGKHIFDKVIGKKGCLKNKTRVLVTHGVQWLPYVDHIIVMVDGHESEIGSYEELRGREGAFSQFLESHEKNKNENDEMSDTDSSHEIKYERGQRRRRSSDLAIGESFSSQDDSGDEIRHRSVIHSSTEDIVMMNMDDRPNEKKAGQLIDEESAEIGQVSYWVYWAYMKAIGVHSAFLMFGLFCVYHVASLMGHIWLSRWTDSSDLNNPENLPNSTVRQDVNMFYAGIYGGLGALQVIFLLLYSIKTALCNQKASQHLHDDMLTSILHSPMAFFDTTPIGRILNRFSGDMDNIDEHLLWDLSMALQTVLSTISTFVIISYSNYWIILVLFPLCFVYFGMQRLYVRSARQLQRIDAIMHSPILCHFTESASGAAIIRAYRANSSFIRKAHKCIDETARPDYCSQTMERCLGVYLKSMGNIIILAVCLFMVAQRHNLSPGIVGLSISSAMTITATIADLVSRLADLETCVVSVERVKEYSDLDSEADWENPSLQPPNAWPAFGQVTFTNYQTRYRPNLPLILNDLSCNIAAGEKVGIVGRTGAGKSSLTLALFRIIEAIDGAIFVDGWNIADLGLHTLRGRLTILPQDPVIFSNTIRFNLDPTHSYSDEQIWTSLELVHLKQHIQSLPGTLEYVCSEGGENFSLGQKQLLCLARSLLHKTKILILDEATAAVDIETDELIQNTIKQEFSDCTVLCIAHRLNTVIDYDRIMVMDHGKVVEFDTPSRLLSLHDSHFSNMMRSL